MARPSKYKTEEELQDEIIKSEKQSAPQPVVAEKSDVPTAPPLPASLLAFCKKYEDIGRRLDAFMVEFKRFRFDLVQAENAKKAILGQVKEAEIRLSAVKKEAQTHIASVESNHRALIDRLTEEKIALQRKSEEYDTKMVALEQTRRDYERLVAEKGAEAVAAGV